MKNFYYILIFSAIVLLPTTTFAEYYAQDYDPSYLPYNFQDAVDSEFDGCLSVLGQYDSGYWQLDEKFEALKKGIDYSGPVWVPMGSESAFNLNQLRDFAEEEIRTCIVDYREYQEEQEKKAEEEAKQQAQEEAEARRLADINKAIDDCDFEFFEEMTTEEKMDTFNEREACKNKVEEESKKPTPPITDYSSDDISKPEIVESVPAPQPTPTPIQTPKIVPAPVNMPEPANSNIPESISEVSEVATSSSEDQIPTITDDVVTVSQEELDRMVEEKAAEKLEQQKEATVNEPEEEKPSVFKRVFNFLFGWLM